MKLKTDFDAMQTFMNKVDYSESIRHGGSKQLQLPHNLLEVSTLHTLMDPRNSTSKTGS